jgi:hypothetical protein
VSGILLLKGLSRGRDPLQEDREGVTHIHGGCRKLKRYFLAHFILVRTDQPLKQVLFCPELAGRMTKWSIKLFEFDITFKGRKALKAQTFTNFLAEFTPPTSEPCLRWIGFTHESSNLGGCAMTRKILRRANTDLQ